MFSWSDKTMIQHIYLIDKIWMIKPKIYFDVRIWIIEIIRIWHLWWLIKNENPEKDLVESTHFFI